MGTYSITSGDPRAVDQLEDHVDGVAALAVQRRVLVIQRQLLAILRSFSDCAIESGRFPEHSFEILQVSMLFG